MEYTLRCPRPAVEVESQREPPRVPSEDAIPQVIDFVEGARPLMIDSIQCWVLTFGQTPFSAFCIH
jgi:hypothetical protein